MVWPVGGSGMSSLVIVLVGVGVVFAAAIGVGVVTAARHRRWDPTPGGHAHNDYRHHRPLLAALDQGFTSVEVDIWPHRGPNGVDRLLVGHDEGDLERWRTLRGLYLEPLARRVDEYGAAQPGLKKPFQLLVEIKSDPERSWELLSAELADYSHMLTGTRGTGSSRARSPWSSPVSRPARRSPPPTSGTRPATARSPRSVAISRRR